MKVIIDIPEEQFTTLNAKTQADIVAVVDHGVLIKAIKDGTPIPKGHGDLIDRKGLLDDLYSRDYTKFTHRDFVALVHYANAVVKGGKQE